MSRRKIAYLAIGVLVVAGLGAALLPSVLSGNQGGSMNAVQVYILNWDLNNTDPNAAVDVVFKISMDLDGNGQFEVEKRSEVLANTTVEPAPFKLGGPLPATATHFAFKVEVFRLINNQYYQLYYTANRTVPVLPGLNEVGASQAWMYDSTNAPGHTSDDCRISFQYIVS